VYSGNFRRVFIREIKRSQPSHTHHKVSSTAFKPQRRTLLFVNLVPTVLRRLLIMLIQIGMDLFSSWRTSLSPLLILAKEPHLKFRATDPPAMHSKWLVNKEIYLSCSINRFSNFVAVMHLIECHVWRNFYKLLLIIRTNRCHHIQQTYFNTGSHTITF